MENKCQLSNYTILDDLIEGCQIISPDWKYIYVNNAAAKQNNLNKDDILGKTVMEVYPDIENTELFFKFEKCMNEKIPLSFENEFTFPDGHKAWFEAKIDPVPEGIFILSADITERKKAENELKESEEKYRHWFEDDLAGNFIATPGGKLIGCNPAFIGIYGFDSLEKAIGYYISKFNQNDWTNLITRLKNEHKIYNYQTAHRRFDGKKIYVVANVIGIFDESNELIQVKGYVFDDTERKKAENELKESEARFHSLYENSYDAILLTEPGGPAIAANPAAQKMFLMSEEEIIKAGRNGLVVVDENLKRGLKEREQKGKASAELILKRKDGATFPGEVTSNLFTDADGLVKTSMIIKHT